MKNPQYESHLVRRLKWEDLDEKYVEGLVKAARAEDIEGAGLAVLPKIAADITTRSLTPSIRTKASLRARRDMTVCGMELARIALKVYGEASGDFGCRFTALAKDGDRVPAGGTLGTIEGPARVILQAERVMLNFLQRLSGVATETAKYVAALGDSPTKLLDTRKTTPGLRVLEKYAFACGGGYNHRIGLFDRVMLKDNHLAAAGASKGDALAGAVRIAREKNAGFAIEVEVDALDQIPPVLEAGADVIMFDNFSNADIAEGVRLVGGGAWTEISGGVTLESVGELGKLGADFVSTAAPVHSSKWIDIGLDS
ncbi:MAG: nicotinate-nucleotide diphosphorylase (carboxylating) [Verrucomicrobia bacterium]|nr:MAG: nicotinate-nucleotide diphosphorylase (carboxylating) [Verrucomicrobiota bacterium]